MKTQETTLIPHEFNHVAIPQRQADGYLNATRACKACGKKFSHYIANQSTQEFLRELSLETGIPASKEKTGNLSSVAGIPATENEFPIKPLIDTKRGGISSLQGTWVHPYVAINLAQWLSPKFAVLVSKWVYEWMTTGQHPIRQESQELQLLRTEVKTLKRILTAYETRIENNRKSIRIILDDLDRMDKIIFHCLNTLKGTPPFPPELIIWTCKNCGRHIPNPNVRECPECHTPFYGGLVPSSFMEYDESQEEIDKNHDIDQ